MSTVGGEMALHFSLFCRAPLFLSGVLAAFCHERYGHGGRPRLERIALVRNGGADVLLRHVWAADRMWQGLVGPSSGAWADAAAVLAESPLYEAPEGKLMNDAARAFAVQVVDAGVATLTAASSTERIDLYGDFLGACGSCHVVTSGGPAPSPE